MARPTKRVKTTEDRIFAAIKLGASYERAAAAGGISYETLRRWMRDGEQEGSAYRGFSVGLKEAEAACAEAALRAIQKAARGGQWQAAAWVLERRWPREYGRTVHEQEVSGSLSIAISRYQPKERDGQVPRGDITSGDSGE